MIAKQLKKYLTVLKGKEIEEVVIDKLKEKHDITYLTEASCRTQKSCCFSYQKQTLLLRKRKKQNPY